MRIGSKEVGEGQPVYIAAEVGCNHSGSLAKAMHQMSLAAKAGADAVKLQVRTPEAVSYTHLTLPTIYSV